MSWLRRLRHSIKLRLLAVFLLLALSVAFIFIGGAQKAFSLGWRDAARPLLMDYVSRLADDVAPTGTPEVARAQAIVARLPVITIDISGPRVNWRSHAEADGPRGPRQRQRDDNRHDWGDDRDWDPLLQRTSADGHTIGFGLNDTAFERRPRFLGLALAALLLMTGLAGWYVHRLLRPLDDIRAGAMRFGAGEFGQPITLPASRRHDELGELATTINTMGHDIHQMLEAQRALLLAISHELRSPLTRARLNTELLPDSAELAPQREALLRDLAEMARLISDLLESERLAGRHAALHREPTDAGALAQEVIDELATSQPSAQQIRLHAAPHLPLPPLDRIRVKLLLRNLLGNALRHSAEAPLPVELHIRRHGEAGQGIELEVRDHGPGVPEDQLPHLAQAFFRPDTARTRNAGGVGLGLYLCRLVAQAHGGTFAVRNAKPGLAVTVTLPPG
ncbi:MAG: HAMP domain-containing sensor histidine kinase [Hydrogenophaga sp.]|uniref:HAMP domain-containing sensor histidine kinase n=1 Tax=Hydrogenophaga sp. TaxID=1904254 RepID=UPI0026382ACC|nr:HAMP domain-containing sensor histidine kinase [Hydrogenophaga sp.]MDM7941801.1 HAMP domain-containing sensor histidine kinase [Hydrogenophaga sp.]